MFYRKCPEAIEGIDADHYKYRWNIQYDKAFNCWSCNEIVIDVPLSNNKITQRVLEYLWPVSDQLKMINEFNAVQNELYDKDYSQIVIDRYNMFLINRQAVKDRIDEDCKEYGIE